MDVVDRADDSREETTESVGDIPSQPEGDVSESWTERALTRPGPDSPFYVPRARLPKWLLRWQLSMLYLVYVGVPLFCAALTIWMAINQLWLGATLFLLPTAWFCYRGWNGLHGRSPYGGGGLPEVRRR